MSPTVGDLISVLTAYFPMDISIQRMLYALSTILVLRRIIQLNINQRHHPHQAAETGWEVAIKESLQFAFNPGDNIRAHLLIPAWEGLPPPPEFIRAISHWIPEMQHLLDWPLDTMVHRLWSTPPSLLITTHSNCLFCHDSPLVRDKTTILVSVLSASLQWSKGLYFAARCRKCNARYYIDRITFREDEEGPGRIQRLEIDTEYLCISWKERLWVHREIAKLQEGAIFRYKSSWSGFSDFLNRTILRNTLTISPTQVQKLFVENMIRRLIHIHGLKEQFTCPPNASANILAQYFLAAIEFRQGVIPGAFQHRCPECTHQKRYSSGQPADISADALMDFDNIPDQYVIRSETLPNEQHWVKMAVMDGKTLSHKICAVPNCRNPLTNYKNGRFCQIHQEFSKKCAIIDCGRDISEGNQMTCDLRDHQELYQGYKSRFARSSFLGVRRVISRNTTTREFNIINPIEANEDTNNGGQRITHMFRARRIYCIETVQWACGMPIAWGKCYDSESLSQVLSLCDRWFPIDSRPQFLVYDKACKLLAHIVAQDHLTWFQTTRFIVDAFHYINHRATDILCREYCNPAPLNGSQPDLVISRADPNGNTHTARAFNTETAEQFNAWMDGFESQLRGMTEYNFDFFIHSIMLLYKEFVEGKKVPDDENSEDDNPAEE